jgi:hypothetical protein
MIPNTDEMNLLSTMINIFFNTFFLVKYDPAKEAEVFDPKKHF